MWVFLCADAMSFGGLLAGYGALRYGDPTWPRPSSILGIQLTALMTFLLICSSVTMVERWPRSGKAINAVSGSSSCSPSWAA